MSFEGYYQLLCPNGHLGVLDAYTYDFGDSNKCFWCDENWCWENLVDCTNDEGEAIVLEVLEPPTVCTCTECGDRHLSEGAIYVIPEDKGDLIRD